MAETGKLRADPAKVEAVKGWPVPSTRKELQCFLGFANFYCIARRFIKNYSHTAPPLSQLTSVKISFSWSDAANTAFERLKDLCRSAPVLLHPDPTQQFVVEDDASDSGVGVVLSQLSPAEKKLHSCAFFYRHLTPTK